MATHFHARKKYHTDDWSFTSDRHHVVERTVQPPIEELVEWAVATLDPDSESKFLDLGCGPGIVTGEIKKGFPDVPVLAVDPAEGMLRTFDRRTKDLGWENVERRALEGHNLTGVPDNSITHAFACTMLDLTPHDDEIVQELSRVIAPGGILGITTWTDPTHPSLATPWTTACRKLHPDFQPPYISNPEWTTAEGIKDKLEKGSKGLFKDIQTKRVVTHWRWKGPEEMTDWWFNGGNPVVKRWHDALMEKYGGDLEDVREEFHKEVVKEYHDDGDHLIKDEAVNLTIAMK